MMTEEEIRDIQARVHAGDKAKDFLANELSTWFTNVVLGAMQDEAMALLAKARTNEDRLKAQQTLLASQKPVRMLDRLVSQGEEARKQISEISTLKEGEDA